MIQKYFNLDASDADQVRDILRRSCSFSLRLASDADEERIHAAMIEFFGPPMFVAESGATAMRAERFEYSPENRWDILYGVLYVRDEQDAMYLKLNGFFDNGNFESR